MRTSDDGYSVLLLSADPALAELLAGWLDGGGYRVRPAAPVADDAPVDLIVVDVAFPRERGPTRLRSIAERHPGTPLLALSSGFLPGVAMQGSVAHDLGVAAVLPKPVTREALIGAVARLLAPRA